MQLVDVYHSLLLALGNKLLLMTHFLELQQNITRALFKRAFSLCALGNAGNHLEISSEELRKT